MSKPLTSCKDEGKDSPVDASKPIICERCRFSVVKHCNDDETEKCGNFKARQKITST